MGRGTDFQLSIPGKITRHFRGRLSVRCETNELVAVVDMELETAVASAVAAESAPGAPLEALKAQAIATRSYYLASLRRHPHFDFCDTTHCQFLREAPSPDSLAAQASVATRGIVLLYDGAIIPALFTGSCGGRTRTLAEVGLKPGPYPYFSVPCNFCRQHAPHWSARLDHEEAAGLASHTEGDRLKLGRILGWDAVPGNNYELHSDGNFVRVEGSGQGHGVGLCQLGAAAMARQGWGFQAILAHYFPNTIRGTPLPSTALPTSTSSEESQNTMSMAAEPIPRKNQPSACAPDLRCERQCQPGHQRSGKRPPAGSLPSPQS